MRLGYLESLHLRTAGKAILNDDNDCDNPARTIGFKWNCYENKGSTGGSKKVHTQGAAMMMLDATAFLENVRTRIVKIITVETFSNISLENEIELPKKRSSLLRCCLDAKGR